MSAEQAKRGAQEALYEAIKNQAETNMRAALRPTEKAQLLRDLAEAYRLTAGQAVRKEQGAQEPPTAGSRERRQAESDPKTESDPKAEPAARKPAASREQPGAKRPARKLAPETRS